MGGLVVRTLETITFSRGTPYSTGKAETSTGEVIEVCNLDQRDNVPAGTRVLVQHAAGGQYHIGRVPEG